MLSSLGRGSNNFGRKYFDTLGIFYLKNVEIKSSDANLMTSLKRGTNFCVNSEKPFDGF